MEVHGRRGARRRKCMTVLHGGIYHQTSTPSYKWDYDEEKEAACYITVTLGFLHDFLWGRVFGEDFPIPEDLFIKRECQTSQEIGAYVQTLNSTFWCRHLYY